MRRTSPFFCLTLLLTLLSGIRSLRATPLITSVVETGANGEQPPAHFTGETFTNSAGLGSITVGLFGEDAPAYTDRVYQWNSVLKNGAAAGLPPYLVGGEYIIVGNDRRDNQSYGLTVAVSRPAMVYLLIDNRGGTTDGSAANPPDIGTGTNGSGLPFMQWVLNSGFAPVKTGTNRTANATLPDEVGVDTTATPLGTGAGVSVDDFLSVYGKAVSAGTFSLGEYASGSGGRDMYGVVVVEAPPAIVVEYPAGT